MPGSTINNTQSTPVSQIPPVFDPEVVNSTVFVEAQKIAEQILQQRAYASTISNSGRIFTYFNESEDVISDQKQIVTTGLWSNNTGSLSTFFTSSIETATQKKYYYDVYNLNPSDSSAEVQFSIAFGDKYGSGSESNNYRYASKAIYSQYKSLLLDSTQELFTFGDGVTSTKIYSIVTQRERMRDKINPGNWQMHLAKLTGDSYPNADYTGSNIAVSASNEIISLIDYSLSNTSSLTTAENEYYYIVSGTIAGGVYLHGGIPVHYGILYPKRGIFILNGDKLNTYAKFNIVSGSDVDGNNINKLFTAISGAAAIDADYSFIARSEEDISSTYYFIRAKNAEYNYSNNASFTTGSLGEIKHKTFISDPKCYISEVGLYNDSNELLAIAKISQPLQKAFNKEVSFAVKLDF